MACYKAPLPAGSVGTAMNVSGITAVATMQSNAAATGISIVAAATGVSIAGAVTGASVVNAPAGGGGAHNNMPPTMIVNYIMRVLVAARRAHTRRNESQRAHFTAVRSLKSIVERKPVLFMNANDFSGLARFVRIAAEPIVNVMVKAHSASTIVVVEYIAARVSTGCRNRGEVRGFVQRTG